MSGAQGRCERCSGPTECIIGDYWRCKLCDSDYALPKIPDLPDNSWDDEEDTNPGWANALSWPPPFIVARQYKCLVCHTLTQEFPDDVANGQGCRLCPGGLQVVT